MIHKICSQDERSEQKVPFPTSARNVVAISVVGRLLSLLITRGLAGAEKDTDIGQHVHAISSHQKSFAQQAYRLSLTRVDNRMIPTFKHCMLFSLIPLKYSEITLFGLSQSLLPRNVAKVS